MSGTAPDAAELRRYLDAARAIATETRAIVREGIARGFEHRLKPDGSFVTDIDLQVEDAVRSRIARLFPAHAVHGEERGREGAGSELEWIVDPIDGTLNLRHGVPFFGTLLALRWRACTVLGLIDLPGLDRCYAGARGLGTHCGARRVVLGEPEAIEDEIVAVGDRRQFVRAGKPEVFDRLMALHPTVRTYGDCTGHALAIEGAVGAMVDFDLRIWDVAASEVLVREAGGEFRLVEERRAADGGALHDVIFGKPAVVRWIGERLGFG